MSAKLKRDWQYAVGMAVFAAGLAAGAAHAQDAKPKTDPLNDLSIEELSGVEITAVSRRAQPLNEAPAAAFVISADDIERAGVRSLPGALRLAPNLQVARIDAANYAIAARGFNQPGGAGNKMLVMIDGRIVYTPLFSGVFWDSLNPVMEDLDRIEVVSGPGGTLWGSNAVNGVINIVSRDAHETTGLLAAGGASDSAAALGLRYGARVGESGAFRVYGSALRRGLNDPDEWQNLQGGFRADWGNARDALTIQGDIYKGEQRDLLPGQAADPENDGGNLLTRWSRRFSDDSAFEVQAYYDRSVRRVSSGIKAEVDAGAIDTQYTFGLFGNQDWVIGGGARVTDDTLESVPGAAFLNPAKRTLQTYHVYAQDTLKLTSATDLILGLKAEHNSYTGMEYLPSARLAHRLAGNQLLWAAVSRTVRTPSRIDTDIVASGLLTGDPDFQSEKVIAYEAGYRTQPNLRTTFSLSTYYNDYTDLRTLEATGPAVYPLEIRNGMKGHSYGVEAWGSYVLTDWWRLNAGGFWQQKDLKLKGGSSDIFGVAPAGNDPEFQGTLRSLMDIGSRTELDVAMRYVDDLPNPRVPSYTAFDVRVGFRLTEALELSVAGYNLFDKHAEFSDGTSAPREFPRLIFFSARWRQ